MEIFWNLSLLVNWMHSQVSPSPPGSWGRLGDAGWSSAGPSGAAGRPAQRCAAAAGTPHAGSDGPWPSVLEDSKCTDTPCCSWRRHTAARETTETETQNNNSREMKSVILLIIKQLWLHLCAEHRLWQNISNKPSRSNSSPCVNITADTGSQKKYVPVAQW